jgi:galactokinase
MNVGMCLSAMPMILPNFSDYFGTEATLHASACGRVNLIGEHTDYNGGFVLPTAIPQKTTIQFKARTDKKIRIASPSISPKIEEYEIGNESKTNSWIDYLQGCTQALNKSGTNLQNGFDALISSDVPVGSGLSSSAALEISFLKGICFLFKLGLNPVAIAKLGQNAEVEFVGARVGIMDQMAASLANEGEALFLDTKTLESKRIKIGAPILVIHSGTTHNHSNGDYNQRRAECDSACSELGIRELRDINLDDLESAQKQLTPLLYRRVRHVVTENARVLKAVSALEQFAYEDLGKLFDESHLSMKDDYEVSIPEIDTLVECSKSVDGVLGARLTGGGFGGSIVALLEPDANALDIGKEILSKYKQEINAEPLLLVPRENKL